MSASYHPSVPASIPHRPYNVPVGVAAAPPGTFAPGTKVQVGRHRVVIEKYLSEGGFAHVYVVKVPLEGGKTDVAVLKRVAVPDKDTLANMRTEVETMKKLKGHRHIVTYIDSHASQLKGGGYEVFLLMEYCQGGGLIDFMNTRLQHRLTEPEILKIFSDVAEGVACMHYLKPPLLHRDLKVENVLISASGSSRIYKLCDFGSTAPPRPAATTAAEGRLIEDDVQRHTTLQYRSPEMIDVYRKQPIDEKSDIWALGVLLYKLCYYTTPFEDQGQMAILNASFRFPPHPSFSDKLKNLISRMLRENPQSRPNIYQVISEVCSIRNTPIPIKDIYATRTQSETRRNQQLPPSPDRNFSPPVIGLSKAAPVQEKQALPEITPMRRGRPTAPASQPTAPKPRPSPSPGKAASADPFAALDQNAPIDFPTSTDDVTSRFPALEEFSLLHDRGAKFEFGQTSPPPSAAQQGSMTKRVTQALADEAFARPSAPRTAPPATSKPLPSVGTAPPAPKTTPKSQPHSARSSQPSLIHQPTPQRPSMISTGVGASPPPSPPKKYPDVSNRPIYRFPPADASSHHHRSLTSPKTAQAAPLIKPDLAAEKRPALELHRSKSSITTSNLQIPKSPASSRPSLEGSRPSALDLSEGISRSKSANVPHRPSNVHVESNLDYLRDREVSKDSVSRRLSAGLSPAFSTTPRTATAAQHESRDESPDENIESNVDFLRAIETHDSTKKKHHRRSSSTSNKTKRTSLPSISLSGTKNILAGKFGDAFRRFENNTSSNAEATEPLRTPSPLLDTERRGVMLTPIAGSEATGDRSDDDFAIDETQDLPPEVRRELERRRLSQEEKRVAAAAAEYRQRLADKERPGGAVAASSHAPSKASTIQNRVKNLLGESNSEKDVRRTAEGYGRFTDTTGNRDISPAKKPAIARKPVAVSKSANMDSPLSYPKPRQAPLLSTGENTAGVQNMASGVPPSSSAAMSAGMPKAATGSKPSAPPKPRALRTGGTADERNGSPSLGSRPTLGGSGKVAATPAAGMRSGRGGGGVAVPSDEVIPGDAEDWEATFTKRYPSLSGLEMVEAEIGGKR